MINGKLQIKLQSTDHLVYLVHISRFLVKQDVVRGLKKIKVTSLLRFFPLRR